jgi:hypothetical protein
MEGCQYQQNLFLYGNNSALFLEPLKTSLKLDTKLSLEPDALFARKAEVGHLSSDFCIKNTFNMKLEFIKQKFDFNASSEERNEPQKLERTYKYVSFEDRTNRTIEH